MPNMIVCVKQIADPEAPPGSFKVDEATKQVLPAAGVSQVVSPFDEQAVEAALRIKDAQGGKITVLSLGKNFVMDVTIATPQPMPWRWPSRRWGNMT